MLNECCQSCICLVYLWCVACVDGCVLGCVCCMYCSCFGVQCLCDVCMFQLCVSLFFFACSVDVFVPVM